MSQTTPNTVAASAPRPRLRKFHFGTGQSDQEIIDQFVVRQSEFERIMEVLEGNINADSCQHLLVVAPRGRGKTTLLVRVIAELRTNPDLAARLLPVRLMEESQEIFTLADFWLECLYFLAKACAPIDQTVAEDLLAGHASMTAQWSDPALEGRARATVLEAADRLGRKLVIMVENLQALSREADNDFGWDLRQVLQSEPQVMLVATATSHFAALEDAKEPFFELFRTICLPALDTEECRCLWQAISGEDVDARRIRPLRILTGGSPRLLVVLAGFSHAHSLRRLMEHLVELIDDHTEYFRSHLEDLAVSERRVYLALIDLWQESTSAEIAARARMDIRKVSAFLGRLVERGAVVAESAGRNRTYYVAERLYSIYYKLRRDRDEAAVVRNLIHFMVTYYQGGTLTELSRQLLIEADQSDGIRQGLKQAATELPELKSLLLAQGMTLPEPVWLDRSAVGIAECPATPEGPADGEAPAALAEVHRHLESGNFEAALRLAERLIAADQAGPVVDPTTGAKLWFCRALAQDALGHPAAAITSYDALLARFGESAEPELRIAVAKALFSKGVTQGTLGDLSAEIASYDALLARFGESVEPELQIAVANALINKGITQGQLGDLSAEIASYDALLARFGESVEPELQVVVATALFSKGVTQRKHGDLSAAITSYDALLARFGESVDQRLLEMVAEAARNAGEILCMDGDSTGALQRVEALRALAELHQSSALLTDADWLEAMAGALLGEAKRVERLFQGIVSRFDSDDAAMLRTFQKDLPTLVALGAEPGTLATVLESHPEALEAMRPLAVALRLEACDAVRAPAEMLEVAEDIRAAIEDQRRQRAS
jgi:tetratricopeptide (TPR) repeat protein